MVWQFEALPGTHTVTEVNNVLTSWFNGPPSTTTLTSLSAVGTVPPEEPPTSDDVPPEEPPTSDDVPPLPPQESADTPRTAQKLKRSTRTSATISVHLRR